MSAAFSPDTVSFEIIADETKQEIGSVCSDEDCEAAATVLVTCETLGRKRDALCGAHAHVMFAGWMVGV